MEGILLQTHQGRRTNSQGNRSRKVIKTYSDRGHLQPEIRMLRLLTIQEAQGPSAIISACLRNWGTSRCVNYTSKCRAYCSRRTGSWDIVPKQNWLDLAENWLLQCFTVFSSSYHFPSHSLPSKLLTGMTRDFREVEDCSSCSDI